MKGKAVKLIIGIILLIIAIVLFLLKTLNPWLCLAIAVLGLIFIILSFGGKEKSLPAVVSEPAKPAETSTPAPEGPSSEPVEVGRQDTEGQGPTSSV